MNTTQKLLSVTLILAFLLSCGNNKNKDTKNTSASSGNINSLNIVIDNENWNGRIGESIRNIFAANVDGLPQQEPLFNLNHLPPSTFSGFARKNRTFLKIERSEINDFQILQDSFAKPQVGILVRGSKEEIITSLESNAEKFINEFRSAELKEQLRRIKKSVKEDTPLRENLGVSLTFPTAYRYAKEEDKFVWMRKDIKNGNMEILIYEVPISVIENDQEVIANVIQMRDSVGKLYIPGPSEGQYMITEEAYAPFIKDISFRGKKAYEVKGTWEVKNAFMAGPFLLYAIKDEDKQRYLIAEGFVFKPSYAKRNHIFEVEAILKSLDFIP